MQLLSNIRKILQNAIYGPILLVLSSVCAVIILSELMNLEFGSFYETLIFLIAYFLFLEILFHFIYYFLRRRFYFAPPKVKFEKLHIEPHPYIPYIFKKHAEGPPSRLSNYPLHYGKYTTAKLKTNNFNFFNGPNGDRDISVPKPNGEIRINCVGASTTQNYITHEGKNHSYPLELEKILKKNISEKIVVNNCGQGGYNSADILVRFLLQTLDSDPDMVLIYHGHADIKSYLTEDFKNDYSHSRKNLSEVYGKLKMASKIPLMPLSFLNFLINHWFPYNTRQSLIEIIHKKEINLDLDYNSGLKIYERNLQYIIDICKARNIKIILSTFCHILHSEVKEKKLFKIYSDIMDKENHVMIDLAKKNNIPLVDNAKLVPSDEKLFVDTIHFSHLGMIKLAENFANEIKKHIKL